MSCSLFSLNQFTILKGGEKMEIISGIYCIENKINGHKYVGLSKNCLKRWSDHYSKSINSDKPDDLRKPLYMAMRKYGRDNFSFTILERCPEDKLKEREIYWIEKLDTFHNGYNATPGGDTTDLSNVLKGENHGMAKLTEADVVFCRKAYREGKRSRDIWEKYYKDKVLYTSFQRMWHGYSWKHVMPEVFENNPHPRKHITEDMIRDIRNKYDNGMTCAEIYHLYKEKISRTSVNDICNRTQFKEIN